MQRYLIELQSYLQSLRRLFSALALLLLSHCTITETGNPGAQQGQLILTLRSSDTQAISIGQEGGTLVIDSVWESIGSIALSEHCIHTPSDTSLRALSGPRILNLLESNPAFDISAPEPTDRRPCRLVYEMGTAMKPLPQDVPAELAGASLLIKGHLKDETPVRIVLEQGSHWLDGQASGIIREAESKQFNYFSVLDIDSALVDAVLAAKRNTSQSAQQAIVIDRQTNAHLTLQIGQTLTHSLFLDVDHDAKLSPEDRAAPAQDFLKSTMTIIEDEDDTIISLPTRIVTNADGTPYVVGYTRTESVTPPGDSQIALWFNDALRRGKLSEAIYGGPPPGPDTRWPLESAQALVIDTQGNVYVTGTLSSATDLGGERLSYAGETDLFLAKYDRSGSHLWSKAFGSLGQDGGTALTVDAQGNCYLAGYIGRPGVDFGDGPTHYGDDIISNDEEEIEAAILVSFDPNGLYRWKKVVPFVDPRFEPETLQVAADPAGNLYWTGLFADSSSGSDLGGGPLHNEGANKGSSGVFLASFVGESGKHRWSKAFFANTGLSSTSRRVNAITADAGNQVAITGSFRSPTDFGGGVFTPTYSELTTGTGIRFVKKSTFLVGFDAENGNYRWSRSFRNADDIDPRGLAHDGDGNLYLSGRFYGRATFGGAPLALFPEGASGDIFVGSYTMNGTHRWSQRFGSDGSDFPADITLDRAGRVWITGATIARQAQNPTGRSKIFLLEISDPLLVP